ncbi:DUF3325 family protein [Pseudoalteromonas sp. T1lg65]|uniref:DUF3325 family protein n=1 Tax=Pseudoalteromonas sp. T1lg65 TaxID=2077101 RepID=UPI003F79A58F
MILFLVIGFVCLAMCLFLLSMRKYTKVLGKEYNPSEKQQKIRRVAAWSVLAFALYLASLELGVVNSIVFMFGVVTLSGLSLSLLFQYYPSAFAKAFYWLKPEMARRADN